MILLEPKKKTHFGEYHFIPRNNPGANSYLYDNEHKVYRIAADLELHPAGVFSLIQTP